MYRRHFVTVMLAVTMALFTATVAAAKATSSARRQPSRIVSTPSPAVLAAASARGTKSLGSGPSTIVAAQQARQYFTQTAAARKIAAYQSFQEHQQEAAARLALVSEIAVAHEAVQNSMFQCIRDAESGDRYEITSGAYGILISTWNAYSSVWSPLGSWSVPGQAPPEVQDLVAYHLYQVGGGYGGWNDSCTGR
jgi:muramidase (phage lysozyme)